MRMFALIINLLVILWVVGAGLYASVILRLNSDFRGNVLIFGVLAYACINFFTILRLKPNKDMKSTKKDNDI